MFLCVANEEVSKINLFLHEFMANIYKRYYIREIQITVVGAVGKAKTS